jgi:hypothetical protein
MRNIFNISIKCIEGRFFVEEFRFLLQMPMESTLEDLASCILGMVDFDGDHASEFYLANARRGKKTWFTTDGEWDEDDSWMWRRRLSDIFPLPKHKKLFYIYDFGDSWLFEITKKGRQIPALPEIEYPRIVEKIGTKPEQYGGQPDEDD